jgi:hypothetical protein
MDPVLSGNFGAIIGDFYPIFTNEVRFDSYNIYINQYFKY